MTRSSGLTLCALLAALACSSIKNPLSPVEEKAAARFGFELLLPNELLDNGWETYSWVVEEGKRDRYRSLYLNRRFVLIVAGPTEITGASSPYRAGPNGRETVGDTAPFLRLRVYDDIPELSFEALADTIRYAGHVVLDRELNGTQIKEINKVLGRAFDPGTYTHTPVGVPRIIARSGGYLYCFYNEHGLAEGDQVMAGFHILAL